jgi:Zinc finger, C3HC4 type (RING finger)
MGWPQRAEAAPASRGHDCSGGVSFVVCQGTAGDGMRNSMEYHEIAFSEVCDHDLGEDSQAAPIHTTSGSQAMPFRSRNILSSTLLQRQQLPSLMLGAAGNVVASPSRSSGSGRRIKRDQILKELNDSSWKKVMESRRKWERSLQDRLKTRTQNNAIGTLSLPGVGGASSTIGDSLLDSIAIDSLEPWWLEGFGQATRDAGASPDHRGELRIFESIPTTTTASQSDDGVPVSQGLFVRLPHILGSLPPGAHVTGVEVLVCDTSTLEPRYAIPLAHETTVVPCGRPGQLQFLRIAESSASIEDSGYVLLDWHGYSLLRPCLRKERRFGHPSLGVESTLLSSSIVLVPPSSVVAAAMTAEQHRGECTQTDPSGPPGCDSVPWYWRVTCPQGAFIRAGLELSSPHVATIPYGSYVVVREKVVNSMGLSRLHVTAKAQVPLFPESGGSSGLNRAMWVESHSDGITGWCSEHLNPLSGQRGSIVVPCPLEVPMIYRVIYEPGVVVRSGIELSSPSIRLLAYGSVVTVIGHTFTEFPRESCVQRLILAGSGGYINLRLNKPPPHNVLLVEQVGPDPHFDPYQATEYHLNAMLRERMRRGGEGDERGLGDSMRSSDVAILTPESVRSREASPQVPSVAAEAAEVTSETHDSSRGDVGGGSSSDTGSSTEANACSSNETRRKPAPRPKSSARDATPLSSFPPEVRCDGATDNKSAGPKEHAGSATSLCLICLSEPRNATMVRGETGHIVSCLLCAHILKARGDACPVCRLPIDMVIQQFWA